MPNTGTAHMPRERFIAEPKPGFDRRGSPREQVFLTGLLVLQDDQVAACVIVDRSETGFRIKLLEDVELPQHFGLIDLVAGVGHRGETVWRQFPFVGARRLKSYDLHIAQPDLGGVLQRAWRKALA